MKKFALVLALVLLATVSASAAEISQAAPVTPALEQILGTPPPLFMGPQQIPPRCSALDGTTCPTDGATTACTDVCNDKLSCTCHNYYTGYPFHTTLSGRYWYCNEEC